MRKIDFGLYIFFKLHHLISWIYSVSVSLYNVQQSIWCGDLLPS